MKEEILDITKKLYHNHLTPETATNLLLDLFAVSKRSELLNICNPPKFQDWLSENFKQRTEFYYDKISNNETYSIKEIESQYVMKFRTNI
jgi:hypothetical protein